MAGTVTVALMLTDEGAQEAARLLHANGIRCAVDEGPLGMDVVPPLTSPIAVVVSEDDEGRAREALEGMFDVRWWLHNPSGQRYLAFENASAEQIRSHVETHPGLDSATRGELEQLAGLLEQHGWGHAGQAFHHLLRPDGKLEGRTLDEWAEACGCHRAHGESSA